MDSPELARKAFTNMGNLLSDDGEIAYNGFDTQANAAFHVSADKFYSDPERISQIAVEQMALNSVVRVIQKATNIIGHITHQNY